MQIGWLYTWEVDESSGRQVALDVHLDEELAVGIGRMCVQQLKCEGRIRQ